MSVTVFADRRDAGRRLAAMLTAYRDRSDALVLALPRGGVPVGYEVAAALGAPLDLFVVRKLGVPGHEEIAFGAIASGGTRYVDGDLAGRIGLTDDAIAAVAAREELELRRREQLYRGGDAAPQVPGSVAILVDDGLATGSTMRAAVGAVRTLRPARIVVAVPVAPPAVRDVFSTLADECMSVLTPEAMTAVGMWYRDFDQTSDDEVRALLATSRRVRAGA